MKWNYRADLHLGHPDSMDLLKKFKKLSDFDANAFDDCLQVAFNMGRKSASEEAMFPMYKIKNLPIEENKK